MQVVVEAILSEKHFGTIFAGRLINLTEPVASERVRVRAAAAAMSSLPVVGETWHVEGNVQDTRWGPQVEARIARRLMPTGKLIIDFIAAHVPGVGRERARRLWNVYGEGLADALRGESNIPAIAHIIAPDRPNLAPRLAAAVVQAWQEASAEAGVMEWLSQQGVEDFRTARRIARILGATAAERLAENPYCLVPLVGWKQVDGIGLKVLKRQGVPVPHDDVRRRVGAVDAAVKALIAEGHTAATPEMMSKLVSRNIDADEGSERHSAAIAAGIQNQAIIHDRDLWRAPGCMSMENAVLDRLRGFLLPEYPCGIEIGPQDALGALLSALEAERGQLHPGQREAVLCALQSPLSCMQGGAGVGKTFTTRLLCDAWEELGGKAVLCALAGKAALKLSRSTGRLARTMARLLGELDRRNAIEQDPAADRRDLDALTCIDQRTLVIVDESSMVDLPTMYRLLQHMPWGSKLLLVGDVAQLPPVGFGLIYHRLASDLSITSVLSHVFRQAAETGIPQVAGAVRDGIVPSVLPYAGAGRGVSFIPAGGSNIAATVMRAYQDLGGHQSGVLIVTATNGSEAGVDSLNRALHQAYVDASGAVEMKGFRGAWFSVGDPVIYLRNRYDLGLFNGLIGEVTAIDPDARVVTVQFDGEDKPHRLGLDDLMDLDHAYAVTCHKCQGSQSRRIIVPVYRTQLVERSWLYTAITRAEEQVVLVGDADELAASLRRQRAADRRTVGFHWH